jgi:hypothetical protein
MECVQLSVYEMQIFVVIKLHEALFTACIAGKYDSQNVYLRQRKPLERTAFHSTQYASHLLFRIMHMVSLGILGNIVWCFSPGHWLARQRKYGRESGASVMLGAALCLCKYGTNNGPEVAQSVQKRGYGLNDRSSTPGRGNDGNFFLFATASTLALEPT